MRRLTRTDAPTLGTADNDSGLARRLRMETRSQHERAESAVFMTELLAGTVPLRGYVELLAQQYFLYSVLEGSGDTLADDPLAAPFIRDELLRVPGLAADLEHFLGAGWRNDITALAATTDYCDRVVASAADPASWIAHHYTRYLGDVSGGAMIRDSVKATYGFTGRVGTRFYDFETLGDIKAFRGSYRRLLDETAFTRAEQDLLVTESGVAFDCNLAMFEDIGAHLGVALDHEALRG